MSRNKLVVIHTLDELAKLEGRATSGPWELGTGYGAATLWDKDSSDPLAIDLCDTDAAFIVELRNHAQALIAAARITITQSKSIGILDTLTVELRNFVLALDHENCHWDLAGRCDGVCDCYLADILERIEDMWPGKTPLYHGLDARRSSTT